jgi:hypothetical protein
VTTNQMRKTERNGMGSVLLNFEEPVYRISLVTPP